MAAIPGGDGKSGWLKRLASAVAEMEKTELDRLQDHVRQCRAEIVGLKARLDRLERDSASAATPDASDRPAGA